MLSSLRNLFGKQSNLSDLSEVHTDLHSHLIPGIDDGAPDLETSMELIHELYRLGYRKLITTPHVMKGMYDNSPKQILEGLKTVRNALQEAKLEMTIEAAAEYYLDESFERWVDEGTPLLTFGDRFVLFETGFGFEPANLRSIIFKLNSEGYKPVFAHPERYRYLHARDLSLYRELKQMGLYFQLNISSLTGAYTPQVRSFARKMIDDAMIDFLGTDLHNKKHLDLIRNSLKEIYLEKLIDSGKLLNRRL